MARGDAAGAGHAREVDAVLLDIDGVLTDGTVLVDPAGAESKRISFEDIDGVFRLKRAGIRIGFITGESTPFCEYVQRRFLPDFMVVGRKDKLAAFLEIAEASGLDPARTCYVGDSRHDEDLLRHLRLSFVPSDVEQRVRGAAGHVLRACRGRGAVAELARWILDGPVPAAGDGAAEVEKARGLLSQAIESGRRVVHLREQRPIYGGAALWVRMAGDSELVEPARLMDGAIAGDLVVLECDGPVSPAAAHAAQLAGRSGVEVILVATREQEEDTDAEIPGLAVDLRSEQTAGPPPSAVVAGLIESLRARARETRETQES